jgi:Bacterial archaeo-eukaryotic release factor family 2
MRLDGWHHLLEHAGPFATVCLDASTSDETREEGVRLRWEASRRALAGHGAPDVVLDPMAEAISRPTGRGGSVGRLVIGGSAGVLVDVVLPQAPTAQEAVWGPAPQLMPAVRALNQTTPYLLVNIDRAGADVELHGTLDDPVELTQIEGDNDVLHKVAGGGPSQVRYQHRAEDSWQRNAAEVVQIVSRLVRRHRPAAVLLAGDEHAVGAFLEHAGPEVTPLSTRLHGGGRADGVSAGAFEAAVADALTKVRRQAQQSLVDRFEQAEGRQDNAVQGLEDVVDALRRGQVDEVLLHDDPSSTLHLWLGDGPLQLAMIAADVRSMGAADPDRVRADVAIAWAALASDAGITLLDQDAPRLNDGISAVLRWSDRSTPRESIPSMPGHGEGRGGEPVV